MTQEPERNGNGLQGSRSRAPGDVLLAAHELWLSGDGASEMRDAVSESLCLPPDAFEAICDFHSRMVARPKDEPLILCRGVSCRLHGADEFHAALKANLDAAGALGTTVDVLCLSQCEHGPNMKLGEEILCTGKARVVSDVRPWRPVTAGPKPVDSQIPPAAAL